MIITGRNWWEPCVQPGDSVGRSWHSEHKACLGSTEVKELDKEMVFKMMKELTETKTQRIRSSILQKLAANGEEIVPWVLEYAIIPPSQPKSLSVLEFLDEISYPRNKESLKHIVSVISNPNDLGWEMAFTIAMRIGEPIIPEIRESIRYYMNDLDFNNLCIQGLCQFLEEADPIYAAEALPELIDLLKSGTDKNHVDEYALWPIRKIGSPKANVVLELLGKIIISKRGLPIRKASIDALTSFDPLAVQLLTNVLKACLSDESKAIRESAKNILSRWARVSDPAHS
jgi:hypothetical protein